MAVWAAFVQPPAYLCRRAFVCKARLPVSSVRSTPSQAQDDIDAATSCWKHLAAPDLGEDAEEVLAEDLPHDVRRVAALEEPAGQVGEARRVVHAGRVVPGRGRVGLRFPAAGLDELLVG